MLIGEICKKTDLSKDTVRFYEKRGLLKVDRSNSKYNNYKEYTDDHIKKLLIIKNAKRFGFTLNEIGELLELMNMNLATCSTLRIKVADKISEIDNRIAELIEMKKTILLNLSDANDKCCNSQITGNCEQLN